ncbi:exonuclease [Gordonia phage SpeedDemon]|nr:exonuclease [Gordonia phage SpeedDemon]
MATIAEAVAAQSSSPSQGGGPRPTVTTPDNPIRVKELNAKLGSWISRLGHIHVEGQVTQINKKPGQRTAWITLRDPQATASINITTDPGKIPAGLTDGDRVIIFGKPNLWQGRASLSLRAQSIDQVGEGDLLQRIEKFRQVLRAEGATRPELKRRLPLLPRRVGLITGSDSAAQRDVIAMATERWPSVDFHVINTPVQGPATEREVVKALAALDRMPDIDVIIVARGGGSVEDLLPFSSEKIVRAAISCTTPVVSAIGHEPDNPVLDDVADFRAATPTDAAKNVVPDMVAELSEILVKEENIGKAIARNIAAERTELSIKHTHVDSLGAAIVGRERDSLATSRSSLQWIMERNVTAERNSLVRLMQQARYCNPGNRIENEYASLAGIREHLDAVSPRSVMERGFSIVADAKTGSVITAADQVSGGARLTITFADGSSRDVMVMAAAHAIVGVTTEGSEQQ